MLPPDDQPRIPAPIGDPRRSAWDKLRGYRYQLWYAVLLWIKSTPKQDVYVETAEDVDLSSPDQIEANQLKNTAAPLSLNTAAAMKALRDYWDIKRRNPDRHLVFNYITTGDAVQEETKTFTGNRKGLDVWESAKTVNADVEEIRTLLLTKATYVDPKHPEKPKPLPDDLIALLQDGPIEQIREQLISPVTWQTNAVTMENLIAQVEDAIYEYSHRFNLLFPQAKIDELKNELHAEAFEIATSDLDRKLTARRFAELFHRKTHITIPHAWRPAQLEADHTQSAPEPPVLPLDWKVPTSDLQQWPTAVGDNRELERPELEAITKTIKETPWSAHLLLGEAGSGKSALMANLTKHLARDNVPYLALKADRIDSDVETLESLVPGLVGQSLTSAIKAEAERRKFVVIVDQLDALCSLTEKKTRPLALLLQLLRDLAKTHNVHLVASCRPFEFASDLRLRTLNATRVQLALPPWEKVADLLKAEGVNPDEFAEGNREVLRVPWNLELYLSLPAPRPVLNSFYELVGKVWEKAVKNAKDSSRCLELVDRIAKEIDEQENFWVPPAITDEYVEERNLLLSEGILLQPSSPPRIGFRHQTFYDYFLLGNFQRERVSIDAYITQHGQSFFIRPTVTRALAYLRDTNPQAYHKALKELMVEGHLRRHLKYLLLEFVGKQRGPTLDEIALFRPMLRDDTLGRQFLLAVTGSRGWFDALLGTEFETEWMASTARGGIVMPLLSSAIVFDENAVVSLISSRWWPNSEFDSVAIWALSHATTWNPATIHLLENYAKRGKIDDAAWALHQLIRKLPKYAALTVGTLFRRKADEILAAIEAARAVPPPAAVPALTEAEFLAATPAQTAAIVERMLVEDPAVKKTKELLAADLFHHAGLQQVAEHDCQGFLRETWAKTKEMLALTQVQKPQVEMIYEDDGIGVERYAHSDRTESVLEVTEKALEKLAKSAPDRFQAWADAEKSSSSLTVHRLIASGALELPTASADWVISYLLEDSRRLFLGGFRDEFEDAKPLISKFAPHCTPRLLTDLNAQIVEIPTALLAAAKRRYPSIADESRVVGVLRRDRAQLLSAFPQGQRPASGQAAFDADVAEFGPPRDRRPISQGGFVGAPVRAEEFAGKTEDEVFAVIDQYPDDCARAVDWNYTGDVTRSGGVFQQAQAFAAFAVTNMEMGHAMLNRLKAGRHEKYATAILSKWAEPKQGTGRSEGPAIPAAEIEQLVHKLVETGFKSDDFRIGAAHVLQVVANHNKGLTPETVAMLKAWLPEMPLPEPETREASDPKDLKESILYSSGGGWTVPTGRAPIVEAIIKGTLYQEVPKIDETLDFLDELYKTERHPAVLAESLIHVPGLFDSHQERMTTLVDNLFIAVPEVMSYSQVFYFLGQIAGNTSPDETEEGWITKFKAMPNAINHLLAGELTILNYVRRRTTWAKAQIDSALAGNEDEEFLRGITFGAATFVEVKTLAADLEPILATTLASPSAKIKEAALTFIRNIDEKTWTPSAKRLIEQILESGLRQKGNSEMIASQMESVALVDPEFALGVAEHYAKKMAEDLTQSNYWTWGASHLTNIALAAQRTEATRERGLQLFENLLDMSLQEAKKAAELMNHREAGK